MARSRSINKSRGRKRRSRSRFSKNVVISGNQRYEDHRDPSTDYSDSNSEPIPQNENGPRRGRSMTRNADLRRPQSRSRSTDAAHSIEVCQTTHLDERDEEFKQLRSASADGRNTTWNQQFPDNTLVVYTDGSAVGGGTSGYGIYMGPNNSLNRSHKIDTLPHDNQRAEILAAIQAIQNIREWPEYRNEAVIIRTDNLGIVKAMKGEASYGRYSNEVDELRELCKEMPNSVTFQWVKAHMNDPGNEAADDLARQATVGAERSRSASRERKRPGITPSPRSHSCEIQPRTRA